MIVRAVLLCFVLAACQSGDGERCQRDKDCLSGLVCNQARNTCQSPGEGEFDAGVPVQIDAPVDSN